MEATETADLRLDSAYFVAFEMTHSALKSGLKDASELNVTQYRALVKLLAVSPDGVTQTELGRLLNLKANVITHIINVLESEGFADRRRNGERDARIRVVYITDGGITHVARVNTSIVKRLYALFPTENRNYRDILEASIAAGAHIDPPLSQEVSTHYSASRTLVSLELIRKATDDALREACGASFNECRLLQRLGEVDTPLRIGDLANQLQLSAVTVARSVDRLVRRSWVIRLASPHDRKAVFVAATTEGERQQRVIAQTIDKMASAYLWGKLDAEQRRALAQVGHVVLADLQARKEAERKAALGLLQPIE